MSELEAELVEFLHWIDEKCEPNPRTKKPCCEACTIKAIHARTRMLLTKVVDNS